MEMRWIYVAMVISLLPFTSAMEIEQGKDTVVTHNEITYIIQEDSGAQEFELTSNGIIIDDARLMTALQGGNLNITLTRWSAGDHQVKLISTVPQTITFKWSINGSMQYIKDDSGLFLDSYRVTTESTQISLVPVDDSTPIESRTTIYRPPWGERTLFFIVIGDQVVYFRNGVLLGVAIFISVASLLYHLLRKK